MLNYRGPRAAVTRHAVERMLERAVDVEVAFDGSKPDEAAVAGQILTLTNPRSEITRGVDMLASMLESRTGRRAPAGEAE